MSGEMSGGADRDSPLRAGFYTGLRSPGAASLTGCDISQRSWMGTLSHSATGLAPSHSHTLNSFLMFTALRKELLLLQTFS